MADSYVCKELEVGDEFFCSAAGLCCRQTVMHISWTYQINVSSDDATV
jgi:hypothetical protein